MRSGGSEYADAKAALLDLRLSKNAEHGREEPIADGLGPSYLDGGRNLAGNIRQPGGARCFASRVRT